jgi:hypothetical protein
MTNVDPHELVERLRECRRDFALVGTSTDPLTTDLVSADGGRFLAKPFLADNLVNLLTGRIGQCVDCGMPIPLRRPKPGEFGTSWICRECGSRYFAVLDDAFPPDVRANVQPAEGPRAADDGAV